MILSIKIISLNPTVFLLKIMHLIILLLKLLHKLNVFLFGCSNFGFNQVDRFVGGVEVVIVVFVIDGIKNLVVVGHTAVVGFEGIFIWS